MDNRREINGGDSVLKKVFLMTKAIRKLWQEKNTIKNGDITGKTRYTYHQLKK